MALNIWALSIVKALGLGYPAFQLVFLRAGVGLVLMLPWILRHRTAFVGLQNLRLHALRVAFSATALTASFFAISRLPLALFTAVGFTRPILTMIAAAWLLREVITRDRWLAALIGLVGVVIAVDPARVSGGWGLAAQTLVVFASTGAVITTRRLVEAPTVVMMTFYTAGLTLITAPFAIAGWQPVPAGQWPRCWPSGCSPSRHSSVSCARIVLARPGSCPSCPMPAWCFQPAPDTWCSARCRSPISGSARR